MVITASQGWHDGCMAQFQGLCRLNVSMVRLSQAVILLLLTGCASEPSSNGVPRPSLVAPGLMRCGQPTPEGFFYLRSIGYSNDVMLATGIDRGAKEAGFNVVYLPITTWQQIFGPCAPKLRAAADCCASHPGTIVHCTHGVNRTGTAVIFYHVIHDGWDKQRAIAEADTFGWESSLPALKKAVRDLK